MEGGAQSLSTFQSWGTLPAASLISLAEMHRSDVMNALVCRTLALTVWSYQLKSLLHHCYECVSLSHCDPYWCSGGHARVIKDP